MKTVFKKAFTGLAFTAMLGLGGVLATPAAHAQYYVSGLSVGAMSSVGGRTAADGGRSASGAMTASNGSVYVENYGYGTYGTANSTTVGESHAVGQHAAAGYVGYGTAYGTQYTNYGYYGYGY